MNNPRLQELRNAGLPFVNRSTLCRFTKVTALLMLGFLLSGCMTNVVVEGTVPTPLVKRIPANVGVYFDDNFRNFEHTEALREEGTWKINLGDQNLTFFRNLMNAMFDSVVELDSPELAAGTELDGVIVPRIEKYGFLTPGISGLKFFSASIHYRITVLDKNNAKIADWTVVGYGKSEGGAFGSNEALGRATMLAIRDGGARISIDLSQQPAITEWLAAEVSESELEGGD